MTVYVDDVRHRFGRMIMCHMWADTEDELLAMADRIGVDRIWIQGHPTLSLARYRNASWVHFDIAVRKKQLALAAGAMLTDKYGPTEYTTKLKLAETIDPEKAEPLLKMLWSIRKIRMERRQEKQERLL